MYLYKGPVKRSASTFLRSIASVYWYFIQSDYPDYKNLDVDETADIPIAPWIWCQEYTASQKRVEKSDGTEKEKATGQFLRRYDEIARSLPESADGEWGKQRRQLRYDQRQQLKARERATEKNARSWYQDWRQPSTKAVRELAGDWNLWKKGKFNRRIRLTEKEAV